MTSIALFCMLLREIGAVDKACLEDMPPLKIKDPTPKSIRPEASVDRGCQCICSLAMLGTRSIVCAIFRCKTHTMSKLFCLAVASGKSMEVYSQDTYGRA